MSKNHFCNLKNERLGKKHWENGKKIKKREIMNCEEDLNYNENCKKVLEFRLTVKKNLCISLWMRICKRTIDREYWWILDILARRLRQ